VTQSEEESQAINAWNLLANGMGGLDWSGLPYVVAHLGVRDVDGLMRRLKIIKGHSPPEKS
jgi:hypothetical protein